MIKLNLGEFFQVVDENNDDETPLLMGEVVRSGDNIKIHLRYDELKLAGIETIGRTRWITLRGKLDKNCPITTVWS